MNTHLTAKLFFVVMVALLLTAPFAAAQEGPQAVGLRPDAPRYAQHGPYWVGVIEQEAETSSHPTKVLVWYPALNPEGAEEITTYYYDYKPEEGLLPIAGHALRDAAPDLSGGPYPLVIFVHGHNAQRHGANWLCEHLASYGFVAMSIDQADSQAAQMVSARYRERLQDVTWQIDYADSLTFAEGLLAGMIDTDRVAVTGHSAGGGTAFEAGGSGGDPRVAAVVAMAPYGVVTGLDDLTPPTLILIGSRDEYLPPSNAQRLYESLGSTTKALVVFQLAHHQIFWYSCDAAPWGLPTYHIYCSDSVWDMDRAHDLANHFITAFLLNMLKNDEDAARFLRPGAKMEGIEYQATGF